MINNVSVHIEYKVKSTDTYRYEMIMENVLDLLTEFGAKKVQWFVSSRENNVYIEKFELPTESHYYALKRLRVSNERITFSELNQCLEGGIQNISFWALKKCS
ncbi:hypothetical protein [Litchfieldia salsa]|uniref:Uncharacterized protein n=1 Tax=Litchfieldia salsa TaxID=930152 RepID=A0A1H0WM62_9BACI|nr:hypothetical protein [Litchfieldia salsa]SDP91789.1 hypothetical protein SAMN05216565_11268 [Litchfieldia salsa]